MTIKQQSRINFSAPRSVTQQLASSETISIFEEIKTDDDNIFYKFTVDPFPISNNPPQSPIYNGKLIHMPIPPKFLDLKGEPIHTLSTPLLFPLLIDLAAGPAKEGKYEHFCHGNVEFNEGTACAQFLQVPSGANNSEAERDKVGANIVYFKTEKTCFPKIKGNPLLDFMVQLHEGEDLWFLPTITPNKTIIYVAFESEQETKDYIKNNAVGKGYFLGLNGFIIYIDHWDCFVFFNKQVMDIKKIKTSITVA